MFRKKIFLILLIPFVILTFCYSSADNGDLPIVKKIFIVNSFNSNDSITGPILNGFSEKIEDIVKKKDFYPRSIRYSIRQIDLKSLLVNMHPDQIKEISSVTVQRIKKFGPDYLFVIGDEAFENIAVQLSREDYKIFFSGLFRSFDYYQKKYLLKKENFLGVEWTFDWNKLLDLFHSVGFIPERYYIIIGDQGSTSRSKHEQILHQKFLDLNAVNSTKTSTIEIKNVTHLISQLVKLNSESRGVIVLVSQKLFNDKTGEQIDQAEISNIMSGVNIKHLEVGFNPILCKFGLAMNIGVSYEDVGVSIAELVFKSTLSEKINEDIIIKENIISVNLRRLTELGLNSFYSKGTEYIKRKYSGD